MLCRFIHVNETGLVPPLFYFFFFFFFHCLYQRRKDFIILWWLTLLRDRFHFVSLFFIFFFFVTNPGSISTWSRRLFACWCCIQNFIYCRGVRKKKWRPKWLLENKKLYEMKKMNKKKKDNNIKGKIVNTVGKVGQYVQQWHLFFFPFMSIDLEFFFIFFFYSFISYEDIRM